MCIRCAKKEKKKRKEIIIHMNLTNPKNKKNPLLKSEKQ